MFALLGYVAFCTVALGQSDAEIIKSVGFTLPVVGTTVSIEGFMLIGPLVLVALTAYLHIFLGQWVRLKQDQDMETLSPPYIFNLPTRTSITLSNLIFYWLPPTLLFAFAFKGYPFLDRPVLTSWLTCLMTMAIAILAIRRRPVDHRRKNLGVYLVLLLMVFILSVATLTGADLTGAIGFTCDQLQQSVGQPRVLPKGIPEACRPGF